MHILSFTPSSLYLKFYRHVQAPLCAAWRGAHPLTRTTRHARQVANPRVVRDGIAAAIADAKKLGVVQSISQVFFLPNKQSELAARVRTTFDLQGATAEGATSRDADGVGSAVGGAVVTMHGGRAVDGGGGGAGLADQKTAAWQQHSPPAVQSGGPPGWGSGHLTSAPGASSGSAGSVGVGGGGGGSGGGAAASRWSDTTSQAPYQAVPHAGSMAQPQQPARPAPELFADLLDELGSAQGPTARAGIVRLLLARWCDLPSGSLLPVDTTAEPKGARAEEG
jgi:hypothetical protein